MKSTRRKFFENSALAAAGLGLSSITGPKAMAGVFAQPASDRLNLAVIGLGMQGPPDLRGALTNPWVHCIGICDVDRERLDRAAVSFKESHPAQTANMILYTDFRKLLENKDIDGVIIAVPDHWHLLVYAEALKAGKHVYVEKPVANHIDECNLLMDLQKKYQRVVTTGLWQTSLNYFRMANEILKTGVLGDVYKVHCFLGQGTDPREGAPDTPAPPTIDYDTWLGPAPQRPYNERRVHGWRGFWDYGGGQQTDWGVHWLDSAFDGLVALGMSDRTEYPKAVFSTAYKHPDTFNETPSCQTTVYQFNNFHIEWAQQVAHLYNRDQGVAWIGSRATLVCNREGYELIPWYNRDGTSDVQPARMSGSMAYADGIQAHATNWCNCIRNNSIDTASPIDKAAYATILAHLGNISFRSGTKVSYDAAKRGIIDNPAADAYFSVNYRSPWNKPIV